MGICLIIIFLKFLVLSLIFFSGWLLVPKFTLNSQKVSFLKYNFDMLSVVLFNNITLPSACVSAPKHIPRIFFELWCCKYILFGCIIVILYPSNCKNLSYIATISLYFFCVFRMVPILPFYVPSFWFSYDLHKYPESYCLALPSKVQCIIIWLLLLFFVFNLPRLSGWFSWFFDASWKFNYLLKRWPRPYMTMFALQIQLC